MSKESNQFFTDLKDDLSAYVDTKLQLVRLSTYEKSARAVALIALGIILFFTLLFALLFIFLTLGYLLGEMIGSDALGFSIVALAYIILLGIQILLRNRIREWVEDLVVNELTKDDSDEEEQTDE
ncbi:MAG: phage holin family protein [Bacteroidales bacterium]|nr:phage holin family protein [Bacteroidales bacterium]